MPSRLASSLFSLRSPRLLLTTACGGGGGGDAPSKPVKSVLGTGKRIRDVVGPADWFDAKDVNSVSCSTPRTDGAHHRRHRPWRSIARRGRERLVRQPLHPGHDEGAERVRRHHRVRRRVHAPGPARRAPATCSTSSASTPSSSALRAARSASARRSRRSAAPDSSASKAGPTPAATIDFQESSDTRTRARYLGMLVTVENVKVGADPVSSDMTLPTAAATPPTSIAPASTRQAWIQAIPEDFERALRLLNKGPSLAKGSTFKSVTGIVTYFYGFKIAPRSPDDFVP